MSAAGPEPDEERPIDEAVEHSLPDHLDPPLEADEADVVEQAIEVPPDEEAEG